MAIVVHREVPADTIDVAKLLDIYTGTVTFWDVDTPVMLFDIDGRDAAKSLFYRRLGKSTSQMKSIWMQRLLLGEGEPPERVTSHREMLRRVAETPGAIGYVPLSAMRDSVRTLAVWPALEP